MTVHLDSYLPHIQTNTYHKDLSVENTKLYTPFLHNTQAKN